MKLPKLPKFSFSLPSFNLSFLLYFPKLFLSIFKNKKFILIILFIITLIGIFITGHIGFSIGLLAFIAYIGNMYFTSTSLWLLTLFIGSFLIISIHNIRKNNSIMTIEEYKNKEHSHTEIEGKIDNLSEQVQKLLLEKEQGKLADQVELEKEKQQKKIMNNAKKLKNDNDAKINKVNQCYKNAKKNKTKLAKCKKLESKSIDEMNKNINKSIENSIQSQNKRKCTKLELDLALKPSKCAKKYNPKYTKAEIKTLPAFIIPEPEEYYVDKNGKKIGKSECDDITEKRGAAMAKGKEPIDKCINKLDEWYETMSGHLKNHYKIDCMHPELYKKKQTGMTAIPANPSLDDIPTK
jgi:hypothetical protein